MTTSAEVAFSPYVVRISREDEEVAYGEEAPLVEMVMDEGGLALRETDDEALTALLVEQGQDLSQFARAAVPEFARATEGFQEVPVDHVEPLSLSRLSEALQVLQDADEPEEAVMPSHPDEYVHVFSAPPAPVKAQRARHHHPFRVAMSFAAATLLVTTPLHAAGVLTTSRALAESAPSLATDAASAAVTGLSLAGSADFSAAHQEFFAALQDFSALADTVEGISPFVRSVAGALPGQGRLVSVAEELAAAGEAASRAAGSLTMGIESVQTEAGLSPLDRLRVITTYIDAAAPDLALAATHLHNVRAEDVPEAWRAQFLEAQRTLALLAAGTQELHGVAETLQTLFGADRAMTYLVVFQNTAELRPTGGFIGSFAEVTIEDGRLTKTYVPAGGSYSMQGQLRDRFSAPPPLQLLRADWQFQDANWFPDFPTSARTLSRFYEAAGGPTTDGVIAINSDFLEAFLGVLGPITLTDGREVNAENVLRFLRQDIDQQHALQENIEGPKQVIGELFAGILERLTEVDTPTFLRLLSLTVDELHQKDVQVFSRQNDVQRLVAAAGFDGGLRQNDGDYLMLVNTNIGGGKSDRVIEQRMEAAIEVEPNGDVLHTVKYTKVHRGLAGLSSEGANNVDFVRLYVPRGAELLSITGAESPSPELFQTDASLAVQDELALHLKNYLMNPENGGVTWEESGKNVIGFWMQTAPQETQDVMITYRVSAAALHSTSSPATLGRYQLFLQEPSGVSSRTTSVSLKLPARATVQYETVPNVTSGGMISLPAGDAFIGTVWRR